MLVYLFPKETSQHVNNQVYAFFRTHHITSDIVTCFGDADNLAFVRTQFIFFPGEISIVKNRDSSLEIVASLIQALQEHICTAVAPSSQISSTVSC